MSSRSAMVLLTAATESEAALVVARIGEVSSSTHLGKTTITGTFGGQRCRVSVTGVGPVNTAHSVTRELEACLPRVVIQFGIAGAYVASGLEVGQVVCATEEIYGDLGVLTPDGWLSMEEIGFPTVAGDAPRFNRFPLDAGIVERASKVCGAPAGSFVTVSQCSGVRDVGDALQARTGAVCENMEGAAAAHVCALYGVPFLEVRGVSNLVVDRDRAAWRIDTAIAAVGDAVTRIVRAIDVIMEGHDR